MSKAAALRELGEIAVRDRMIALLERQLAEANRTVRELTRALRPASAPVSPSTPTKAPEAPDPRTGWSDEVMDALLEIAPDPESELHRAHVTWIQREMRKGKSALDIADAIRNGLDPDQYL